MDQINVGQIVADLTIHDNTDAAMAKARAAMDRIAGELRRLESEYKQGIITITAYESRVKQLTATQIEFSNAMSAAYLKAERLGKSALGMIGQEAGKANQGVSKFGSGMMQLGYAVDDLQYGLGAVVNNIGQVVAGLGVGAGIAGGLQVAAVAANVLYNNWDKMRASWGDTSGVDRARATIEGMTASVKELSTAIDTAGNFYVNPFGPNVGPGANDRLRGEDDRLRWMKDADGAAAAMDGPEVDEAAKKRVVEAVKSGGGTTEVARKIADAAIAREGLEGLMTDAEKRDIRLANEKQANADMLVAAEMGGMMPDDMKKGGPKDSDEAKAIRESVRKRIDAETERFVGGAALDPEKAKALEAQMRAVGLDTGAGIISGKVPTRDELAKGEKENAEFFRKKAADEKAEAVRMGKSRRGELERDREWREANNQLATLRMPELSAEAKKAQDAIDAGGSAEDEQASLASRLERAGMSAPDAAEAARDAMSAQAKVDPVAREKRRQVEAKQAQTARDAAARDAMEKAKDALPGIGDIAEAGALRAMAGGMPMAEVAKRIKAELKRQGLSPEDSELAGNAATADGMRGAGERVMRKALSGREVSMSQTLAASDLTRQAQAGVASNGVEMSLKRIEDHLSEVARNGKNVVSLRVE